MSELTYEDFKQRINIQEVLQDAGYRLNRKDGIRYPSYVRLDSNGRRIRGDKFIVTRNGLCCFQPPEQRNYNIISFIKEHPHFFAEYTPGMSKDRLVNLVCNRLLNQPMTERNTRVLDPRNITAPSMPAITNGKASTGGIGRARRNSIPTSRTVASTLPPNGCLPTVSS